MEHKEIELYLVEYSDDAVDKTIRPLIKKHIEVCDSCQDQLKVIQHVRDIISTHGNAIFEDHPLSSDLASFSIRENQLTAEEMAVIGIHLQHCPTCMYEVGISQKALSDAKKTEDGCVLFEKYTMRWKRVALVAAVLALALLYPAWRGIQSEDVYSGGGVEVLYVCETTRDASDLPSVSVQPGQQFLPVMIDEDLEELLEISGDDLVDVSLTTGNNLEPIWQWHGAVDEITDEQNGVVSLLIKLPDGIADMDTLQLSIFSEKSEKKPVVVRFLVDG